MYLKEHLQNDLISCITCRKLKITNCPKLDSPSPVTSVYGIICTAGEYARGVSGFEILPLNHSFFYIIENLKIDVFKIEYLYMNITNINKHTET